MPTLLPLQDYSEHEVLNFYKWSGAIPVNRGTFVKIGGSGYRTCDADTQFLGSPGATYGNTVSHRYGITPYVVQANSGDNPIGCLLFDVKETDENGEKLILHPHKWNEIHAVPSGKAVPILVRGNVLYSGILESVTAGNNLYISGGTLTPTNNQAPNGSAVCAVALGAKDEKGWCYIKVKCQ